MTAMTAQPTKAIAYLRVSTDKQGMFGLGMDAQEASIAQVCQARGLTLARTFREVESGKRGARPQLIAALDMCAVMRVPLIVAKLDRLSRDVDLIRAIQRSGQQVIFCDMPQLDDPNMRSMVITVLALMAEMERKMIGQRTKAALGAAKARGTRLGNAEALARVRAERVAAGLPPTDTSGANEARARSHGAYLARMAPIVDELHAYHLADDHAPLTPTTLAAQLNERGIPAPRGAEWSRGQAHRLLEQLSRVEAPAPTRVLSGAARLMDEFA